MSLTFNFTKRIVVGQAPEYVFPQPTPATMSAISKESLHSVLAKVEELALPEGEYLTLCSLLKKQFETLPAEILFQEPRDTTLVFTGKKVITIVITHRIVYKGQAPDQFRYTINGVAKETDARRCGVTLGEFHRMNLTKTILLNGEFETTFREYKKWAESVDHDDDEDDYCDFNTPYLMLHMAGLSDA
jgi:hypothetical protein